MRGYHKFMHVERKLQSSSVRMFVEDVNQILESREVITGTSIWNYVEAWKQFVQLCEDGYCFDIAEYDNDIYCRQLLQYVIDELKLVVYPDYWDLVDREKNFNNRFLAVYFPIYTEKIK